MGRQETWAALRCRPEITVLIVGGGINGLGLLRELAQQGIDTLLVEKGDFCSGASAASSHMVHGGLRYLENGEFRLVREALLERNLLLQNAPHYVHPLPTTVPVFRWFSGFLNAPLQFLRWRDRPGERGVLVIKIGLLFYDWWGRHHQSMPRHIWRRRGASLQRFPKLNPAVIGTATYYDAWMPAPERIALELLLDAEALSPHVRAANYVALVDAAGDTVRLRDELTGEMMAVKPKIVVNAAGPWIDRINRAMNLPTQFIGGTKGSHLILNHPELRAAVGDGEFFFENDDGRIVLLLGYLDRVMVGTSDIPGGDPDEARCTEAEIDYFLGMIHKVFPVIPVDRSHIVFHFSGVRPLSYRRASLTGQISRDHQIVILEAGEKLNFPVLALIGGKWTTFRALAEQTTDAIMQRLGQTRQGDTRKMPIGGGRDFPRSETARREWLAILAQETGLDPARLETLLARYGTRARAIALFLALEPDAPVPHQPDYSRREVRFLAQSEKIAHLDDFCLRRSSLGMRGEITRAALVEFAGIIGAALGWSEAQTQAEVERAAEILRDRHGVAI